LNSTIQKRSKIAKAEIASPEVTTIIFNGAQLKLPGVTREAVMKLLEPANTHTYDEHWAAPPYYDEYEPSFLLSLFFSSLISSSFLERLFKGSKPSFSGVGLCFLPPPPF
jgi:hypothetical protein